MHGLDAQFGRKVSGHGRNVDGEKFASSAICAAVGAAFSTGSSPIFEGLPDDDVEDEFEFEEPDLNLLVRLQAATTNTKATSKKTCFIGPSYFSGVERQTPFTLTRRRCQIVSCCEESLNLR